MLFLSGHYLQDECHITPSVIVRAVYCENPHCGHVHGFQFIIHWLWWAGMLTVGRK